MPQPPRPPSSSRPAQAGAPRGRESSLTSDGLRRRLAQAEMHLREMEEEARRVAQHQSRELELLENDHRGHLDRLELIRMAESMTPAEIQAIEAETRLAASFGGGGANSAPSQQQMLDSKLLAATSTKYLEARDAAQRKRAECAEAEAVLAEAKNRVTQLRHERQQMSRESQSAIYAATMRRAHIGRIECQSREQLRGLEVHLVNGQERVSGMVSDARSLRTDIDALLIAQSGFEKSYRKREDELLEAKRQMSFLSEVCILLIEERQQKRRVTAELRALSDEENKKYEAALEELDAVLTENKRSQRDIEERLESTRLEVREARRERHAIVAQNAAAEAHITAERQDVQRRMHSTTSAGGASSDNADSGLDVDPFTSGAQQQIRQFDLFYERLAELAGSDRLDVVVGYPDVISEARFSLFSELNHLNDELAALEAEREILLGGAAAATTSPSSAAASEAAEDTGSGGADPDAAALRAAQATAELRTQRSQEIASRQATLDRLKLAATVHGEEGEALDGTCEAVVAQVQQAFAGLGCDTAVISAQSGGSGVLRRNLLECLALIDQRTDEYLLCLARAGGGGDEGSSANAHAARSILRRADLLPRIDETAVPPLPASPLLRRGSVKLAAMVVPGGGGGGGYSARQLVQRSRGGLPRSVDAGGRAGLGTSGAAASGSPPPEDDVPLGTAEMHRIVADRLALAANAPSGFEARRF